MTNILQDTAIIVAPTFRSRAYVQGMQAAGLKPARAYLLPGVEPLWGGPDSIQFDVCGERRTTRFRVIEPAAHTLESMGVECVALPDADINDEETVKALSGIPEQVLIFSGKGGSFLRPPILRTGKRFLHVHGGWAPKYKGSTAFYFSLLKEGVMGASAIWLDEGIDTGNIIKRRKYPAAHKVDIDCIVDPLVRADLLIDVLSRRLTEGRYADGSQMLDDETTYHVIHPVLKHIALRRCELVEE